jgi:acyl-CoA synthetase (AMP-forming)/AMP-acid ligase II
MNGGLREWAERDPARLALRFPGGEDVNYGALECEANRLAHLMRRMNLSRGGHIACILKNGPLIVALAWAAARSGIYLTPIAPSSSAADLTYIVRNSTAGLVFFDSEAVETALMAQRELGAAPRWIGACASISDGGLLEEILPSLPATPINDESPGALMLYTSGTTGAPKGVIRPLATAEEVGTGPPPFARDLLTMFPIDADTRYLSTQPLYHAAAYRFALATLAAGGMAVVMPKFDAGLALSLIGREQITMSQWVPTMFHRLLNLLEDQRAAYIPSTHRLALHGAAPCAPAIKRRMIDWWGPIICEYYSGTEGVGLCAITSAEWLSKPGSVGRPWKGKARILAEDMTELAATKVGRIYFSGVAPFAYFNDPAKTAEKTTIDGYQTFGDVGYLDSDGYLFLTDRLDDMIISGGVNIYPQELERAISEAPGIADCGVIGCPSSNASEQSEQCWNGGSGSFGVRV